MKAAYTFPMRFRPVHPGGIHLNSENESGTHDSCNILNDLRQSFSEWPRVKRFGNIFCIFLVRHPILLTPPQRRAKYGGGGERRQGRAKSENTPRSFPLQFFIQSLLQN